MGYKLEVMHSQPRITMDSIFIVVSNKLSSYQDKHADYTAINTFIACRPTTSTNHKVLVL